MERVANCSCGQLRAVCRGEPVRLSVCSCLACKRRTGSAFSWNATYPEDEVVVSGHATMTTRRSDEGRWVRLAFCPTCGDTVAYTLEVRPGRIGIPVGAFADPGFPAPTIPCYAARRERWLAFASDQPISEE